jgi:uncharacterized membrane protein YkvA (DUF1232 family)
MIHLLKQHIESIYQDYQNNGIDISSLHPYLSDEQISSIPSSLASIVLSIPDMLQELVDLMLNSENSQEIRAIASGIYSYVFIPLDYISDTSESISGFLDDALVLFYGLHFLEKKQSELQFKTIRQKNLIDGIEASEIFFNSSLISSLKDYPLQISRSIQVV